MEEHSESMSVESLKAELRAVSPETRDELFTYLLLLRRGHDPERARRLAEKIDDRDPAGWMTLEEARERLDEGAEPAP
jgi:hypothetical protein